MAIDIKGLGPNQGNVSQSRSTSVDGRTNAAGSQGKGAAEQAPAGADSVSLSPEVRVLQNLENNIRELPEVDSERVEAIRNAIADGSYQIDNDRLAASIVRLERMLGS